MTLLARYLGEYRGLIALALALAAINQIFSLLDPLIFRYVIDEYATRYQEYTTHQFFRGVGALLLAAVGVAFVSRVAKNFQDYFINVITQRLGAHSGCELRSWPLRYGNSTSALRASAASSSPARSGVIVKPRPRMSEPIWEVAALTTRR